MTNYDRIKQMSVEEMAKATKYKDLYLKQIDINIRLVEKRR